MGSFQNRYQFPKLAGVSKTGGSSGKWGEFPKPVPVSKTGGSFQNRGEFWKVGGVSKTGARFQNRGGGQNRYQFPKPSAVSKTGGTPISSQRPASVISFLPNAMINIRLQHGSYRLVRGSSIMFASARMRPKYPPSGHKLATTYLIRDPIKAGLEGAMQFGRTGPDGSIRGQCMQG
jgi:hypothetical protein